MTGAALTYGSVCSGIEAASQAWSPLGWRAAFVSEIEAFPRAVLQHRWPEAPLHGDFTTIRAGEYAPIDLLVGGTPCQSFSVAGLRGGLGDDRGNLALEYLRLADRLRPRWLVWENVPGVLSSAGGRDFGAILGGMVELGYGVAYRVLDAQFFGVAQRRRRVFVVGNLGDWRRAAAVLFERSSLCGDPPPSREMRKGPAGAADGGPALGFNARQDPDVWSERCGPLDVDPYTQAVAYGLRSDAHRSGEAKTPSVDAAGRERLRDAGFNPLTECAPTLDASAPHAVAFALRGREGGAMLEVGGDQVGSLRAASGGSSRDYVAIPLLEIGKGTTSRGVGPNGSGLGSDGDPMFTLQAGAQHGVGTCSAVRRLTPRECERLQGFPDDYTLIPWRRGLAADGPRYKALGNSMAVPVMRWIGERIAMVEPLAMNNEAEAA